MNRSMLVWTISMLTLATPALAQRGGGAAKPHGAPAPKPVTTQGAMKAPSGTPKPTMPQGGAKVHGNAPKSGTAPKSGAAAKSTATTKGSGRTATKTAAASSTKSTTKTTKSATVARDTKSKTTTKTSGTSSTSGVALTPVQQKLQRNTNLASKLQSRLPAGTDLQLAAAGFRNLGQFVAAVNVSNNLGIPFTELKTRMVDQGMSLGQAIQDARPTTTDTTTVVRRAETDADDLIRSTDSTTTAKTRTTRKPSSGGGRK